MAVAVDGPDGTKFINNWPFRIGQLGGKGLAQAAVAMPAEVAGQPRLMPMLLRPCETQFRSDSTPLAHALEAAHPGERSILPPDAAAEVARREAEFARDLRPRNAIERDLVRQLALGSWRSEELCRRIIGHDARTNAARVAVGLGCAALVLAGAPGGALAAGVLLALSVNLLGDWLRDALDPRLRR